MKRPLTLDEVRREPVKPDQPDTRPPVALPIQDIEVLPPPPVVSAPRQKPRVTGAVQRAADRLQGGPKPPPAAPERPQQPERQPAATQGPVTPERQRQLIQEFVGEKQADKASEAGFFGSAAKGLMSGIMGVEQAVGGTFLRYVGDKTGIDEISRAGKSVEKFFEAGLKQYEADASLQGSIVDDPGLLKKPAWWAYNISNMLPSFAASIVPGAGAANLVSKAGKAKNFASAVQKTVKNGDDLAGFVKIGTGARAKLIKNSGDVAAKMARIGKASRAAGATVGGLTGGMLEGAHTYREAYDLVKDNGGSEQVAKEAATMAFEQMTAASGLLNSLSVGRFLRNPEVKSKIGEVGQRTISALTEGLTEYLEGPAEAGILINQELISPEEAVKRIKDELNVVPPSMVIGFLVPGLGGNLATVEQGKKNAEPDKPVDVSKMPDVDADAGPAGRAVNIMDEKVSKKVQADIKAEEEAKAPAAKPAPKAEKKPAQAPKAAATPTKTKAKAKTEPKKQVKPAETAKKPVVKAKAPAKQPEKAGESEPESLSFGSNKKKSGQDYKADINLTQNDDGTWAVSKKFGFKLGTYEGGASPATGSFKTKEEAKTAALDGFRKTLNSYLDGSRNESGISDGQIAAAEQALKDLDKLQGVTEQKKPADEVILKEQATTPEAVKAQANEAATSPTNDRAEPTEAQKEFGNYKKGRVKLEHLPEILVENPAGSERSGTSRDGTKWKQKMKGVHYGYFPRSEGADNSNDGTPTEGVDVMVKDGKGATDPTLPIFVVDQQNKDKSFDEHKVMVGFDSEEAATKGYLDQYEKGWTGLQSIVRMEPDQFKEWLKDPKQTKKEADQANIESVNPVIEKLSAVKKVNKRTVNPFSKKQLLETARELEISTKGNKTQLGQRIRDHQSGLEVPMANLTSVTDPRLNRKEFRQRLESMADELIFNGDTTSQLVREEAYEGELAETGQKTGEVIDRLGSRNPTWYQSIAAQPETKIDVNDTKKMVKKALAGEKLGVREQRFLQGMLDQQNEERSTRVDFAKQQLDAARAKRNQIRQDVGNEPDPFADIAGEKFEEFEYDADQSAESRIIEELMTEAESIKIPELERLSIVYQDDDAGMIKALEEKLNEQRNQAGATQGQGEPTEEADTQAPRVADQSGETGDIFGEDTRTTQGLADEVAARDAKRNAGQESLETGDPTDLFSEASKQTDIEDVAKKKPIPGLAAEARESLTPAKSAQFVKKTERLGKTFKKLRASRYEDKAAFKTLQKQQQHLEPRAYEATVQHLAERLTKNPTQSADEFVKNLGNSGVHSGDLSIEFGGGWVTPVRHKMTMGEVGLQRVDGIDVSFKYDIKKLFPEVVKLAEFNFRKERTETIVKRAPNFAEEGEYDVTLPSGNKLKIYRDPESGYWLKVGKESFRNENLIGFTRKEAIAKLESQDANLKTSGTEQSGADTSLAPADQTTAGAQPQQPATDGTETTTGQPESATGIVKNEKFTDEHRLGVKDQQVETESIDVVLSDDPLRARRALKAAQDKFSEKPSTANKQKMEALEKHVNKMKTSTAPDDVVVSAEPAKSVGKGMKKQEVFTTLFEPMKRFQNIAKINVAETADELPTHIPKHAVGAWTSGKNEVWLVADKLKDAKHAEQILVHELFGHKTVEQLPNFKEIVSAVDGAIGENGDKVLKQLSAEVFRTHPDVSSDIHAREVIARLAQTTDHDSLSAGAKRVIGQIKKSLSDMGFKTKFSDADLLRHINEGAKRATARAESIAFLAPDKDSDEFKTFRDSPDISAFENAKTDKQREKLLNKMATSQDESLLSTSEPSVQPPDDIRAEFTEKMGTPTREQPLRSRVKTTAKNLIEMADGNWREPMREHVANMTQGLIDSGNAIKVAERAANDGELLDASVSAYKQFSTVRNLPTVMALVMHYGVPTYNSKEGRFVGRSAEEAKSFEEVFLPLRSLIAEGTNESYLRMWEEWAVAKRAFRLIRLDKARGTNREKLFDEAKVKGMLDWADNTTVNGLNLGEVFEEVNKNWQELNTQVLDMGEELGVITKADKDRFYENDYVPFWRELTKLESRGQPGGKGVNIESSGIKNLFGATDAEGNAKKLDGQIVESMFMNTANLIDRIYRNQAMKRIAELGVDQGMMTEISKQVKRQHVDIEELARHAKDAGFLSADTYDDAKAIIKTMKHAERKELETFYTRIKPVGDDIVTVFDRQPVIDPKTKQPKKDSKGKIIYDDKPKYYRVTDKMYLRSIKGLSQENMGGIMALLRGSKKVLTTGVTTDPAFMIANSIRDTVASWIVSDARVNPFKGFLTSAKEAYTVGPQMLDLMYAGRGGGQFYDTNPDQVRKLLKNFMPDKEIPHFLQTIVTPRTWWETWKKVGNASELLNRMTEVRARKEQGASDAEALWYAQDLLNFTRSGDFKAMQIILQSVPFMNARIQGLNRMVRGAKDNPQQFMLKGGGLAIASLMLALKNDDDDRYNDLPEWDKDAYFHFFIGDEHIRVPKPFEVGFIFGTLPERSLRLGVGDDQGDWKLFKERMLTNVLENLNFNPIPQAAKPLIEQFANKSMFTHSPIVGTGLASNKPEAQYDARTAEIAKVVAEAMPDSAPDWLRSPKRLEAMTRGYFAALGTYMLGMSSLMVDTVMDNPEKPAQRLSDRPVLRRFLRPEVPHSTKYDRLLWESLNEADEIANAIRKYRDEGLGRKALGLKRTERDKLVVRKRLRKLGAQVRDINARMERVRLSNASPESKRKRIDRLQEQKNKVTKRAGPLTEDF